MFCSFVVDREKKEKIFDFFFDGQPTWKYLVRVGWGLKDWRGDGWMTMMMMMLQKSDLREGESTWEGPPPSLR